MYEIHYNSIFADYLSVTTPPDTCLSDDLHHYLVQAGYQETSKTPEKSLYSNDDSPEMGTILFDCNDRYHAIQLKGLALKFLRETSQLDFALGVIASHPHSVTRLDLAVDREELFNTPVRRYKRKYSNDLCPHVQSRLKMAYMLRKGLDGNTEGSIYFGGPRDRHAVKAIVYNKSAQMLSEYGIQIPPFVTRYELRFFKRAGASLRDVSLPESLFYEHASIFGVKKPSDVPAWVSGACLPNYPPPPKKTAYSRLQDYLERNKAFSEMITLADDMGPHGRDLLVTLLTAKIEPKKGLLK